MMLCAGRVDHTLYMYDIVEDGEEGWTSTYFKEKPELIEKHRCALMNLPYVVDRHEKRVICQTNACMEFLGREIGMLGKDKAEQSKCEQLLCEIYDLRDVMTDFTYGSDGSADKAKAAVKQASNYFNKLELCLKFAAEDQGTDATSYLVGNCLSAPDFHLYEMLDQWCALCDQYEIVDFLHTRSEMYPRLRAFKSSFEELEENQFYLKCWLHRGLPFNNCMAKFGSAPGPAVYKRGQTAEWMGKGEVSLNAT